MTAILLLVGSVSFAGGTALPARRPADFSVSYSIGDGSRDMGSSIIIQARGGSYASGMHVMSLQLTGAELDAVYATLRANRFDQIETRPRGTAVVGGESMSVIAGGKTYVVDGNATSVADRSASRWRASVNAVVGIAARKVRAK